MAIETSDLERRVLAHERVLQALIARLVTSDPLLMDHLNDLVGAPAALERREHDPTGSASHAEQTPQAKAKAPGSGASTPAMLRVRHRHGVWQVTRNQEHYGDYCAEEAARDAAKLAVGKIVAHGGSAEIC